MNIENSRPYQCDITLAPILHTRTCITHSLCFEHACCPLMQRIKNCISTLFIDVIAFNCWRILTLVIIYREL